MFKVGDRVKLICKFAYGTLGTVVDTPKSRYTGQPGDVYVKRDPAGPTDCLRYHESELELIKHTPHKHAALIKAWADDTSLKLQCRRFGDEEDEWANMEGAPNWSRYYDYRIKPEPRPDAVAYAFVPNVPKGYPEGLNRVGFYDVGPLQLTTQQTRPDNVKLTFDGETGKLKSVELIS